MVPLFLGILLAYGFALSRPIGAETRRDVLWMRIVYGTLFAFVPGVLLLFLISSAAPAVWQRTGWRSFPIEIVVIWAFQLVTAAGMGLASYKIVERRGTKLERKLLRPMMWTFAVSGGLFAVFFVLDFLLWDPFSSIDYIRVGMWLCIPGAIAFLMLLVLALRRMTSPVEQAVPWADPSTSAPEFVAFRG